MNGKPAWPSVVVPIVVAGAAAWSLVPFALWWADADSRYFSAAWGEWLQGSLIAAAIAAVLLVLLRQRLPVALLGVWKRVMAIPRLTFVTVSAGVFALLAVLMCRFVFDGNPRNVDGFAQLFQARIFLAGRLWVAPPPEIANFATLQMILGPDHWFAQYPPGQALVLAAGLLLGAWWLLNPLIVVALVFATHRVAAWCADRSSARLALLLACVSPFVIAVAGSEMSHLAAATLGMAAAAAATGLGGRRPGLAASLAGAALGVMVAFRPLDAVAAAAPVALIVLLAAPRRVRAFALIIASGAAATLPTLWYNAGTTGSWHQFGYSYLWGPQHSLGFHPVPWGVPLTFTRAIALTGVDLHQVNTYLFDLPVPILVIVAAGFVAGRRAVGRRDAVPVLGVAALSGLLFFYFHRDVFYGPRFLFSAVPWIIVLTARSLVLLRRSGRQVLPGTNAGLVAAFFVLVAFVAGFVRITPARLAAYREATPIFDLHPDRDAARSGVGNAVVVVPDGWGTRLITRMWAMGVPVRRSTRLYAAIDACTLEGALDEAEGDAPRRARLIATLDSLAALHRPGFRAGLTEDPNLRVRLGATLPRSCSEEIAFDRRGFLQFAPFLYLNTAHLDGDIVWARDLRVRNAALLARYPGRRFYRYAPPAPGERPTFTPIDAANGSVR
ncbi:MAG: hypothetical protein AABY85_10880 [Gemmatimonadota bacterium]